MYNSFNRAIKCEFSDKELEMIKLISPHWFKLIGEMYFNEPTVLEILGKACFIENVTGPAVDSLRRCLKALSVSKPYRLTKEYDDLIQLDVEKI